MQDQLLILHSFVLNEVIPLCINPIYLLYYKIPSPQHKNLSYRYMFRINKSSSGVSKNHKINPLEPELFFLILAHSVYKM